MMKRRNTVPKLPMYSEKSSVDYIPVEDPRMPFKLVITRDFDHMSEAAARFVVDDIKKTANTEDAYVLGLATGNTPTGLHKYLAKTAETSKASPYGILPLAGDPPRGILQSEAEGRRLRQGSK